MTTLYDEINACGEIRMDIGGPKKFRCLTNDEIMTILNALELVEGVKNLIKQIEEGK